MTSTGGKHGERLEGIRARAKRRTQMEIFWLIERGQPEGLQNAEWYGASQTYPNEYEEWTRDPNKACRWTSKESAERALPEVERSTNLTARVTEHAWSAQPLTEDEETVAFLLSALEAAEADARQKGEMLDAILTEAPHYVVWESLADPPGPDAEHTPDCPGCAMAARAAALGRA